MTERARSLQSKHVLGDVTPLALALAEAQSDLGLELMHGDPESCQLAYPAGQVLMVTAYLADKLKASGERVISAGSCFYWARKDATPCIHLDDVFLRIARAQT